MITNNAPQMPIEIMAWPDADYEDGSHSNSTIDMPRAISLRRVAYKPLTRAMTCIAANRMKARDLACSNGV